MRPLKRVTNSTGNPRHELSQFRAPEKERTRKIKKKKTLAVGPMIYLQQNNILEMMEMIVEKKNVTCESNAASVARVYIVGE